MSERWFVFMGEGLSFGVQAIDGIITFVGPDGKPVKPEWVGKTLQEIRPFLVEKKYVIPELK